MGMISVSVTGRSTWLRDICYGCVLLSIKGNILDASTLVYVYKWVCSGDTVETLTGHIFKYQCTIIRNVQRQL